MFGNLAHIRGIVYYKISPHEQRAFAKVFQGLYNFIPRTCSRFITWGPVFIGGFVLYKSCEAMHAQNIRKDFRKFDDEVMPEGYEFPDESPDAKLKKNK